jgi:hypothetical protein
MFHEYWGPNHQVPDACRPISEVPHVLQNLHKQKLLPRVFAAFETSQWGQLEQLHSTQQLTSSQSYLYSASVCGSCLLFFTVEVAGCVLQLHVQLQLAKGGSLRCISSGSHPHGWRSF